LKTAPNKFAVQPGYDRASAIAHKAEKRGAGLANRQTLAAATGHSLGLAISSLITYLIITHVLAPIHSISKASDLLGGMWAVIANLFVYRQSHRESINAALTRASATLLSFVLCLIYLLIFSFHPLGLAVLIGLGTFILMAVGHDDLVVTAASSIALRLDHFRTPSS
jgi:hypothetical protein